MGTFASYSQEDQTNVYNALLACQHAHQRLQHSTDDRDTVIFQQHCHNFSILMQPYLAAKARVFWRFEPYNEIDTLAVSLFTYIFIELPALRPDPNRNVIGYLCTIASNRYYDEHRRLYGRRWSSQNDDGTGQHTGPREVSDQQHVHVSASHEDPDSVVYVNQLNQVIEQFRQQCKPEDGLLLKLRMCSVQFSEIARHIKAQFDLSISAATLRKRYERLRERLQQYLLDEGFSPDLG